MTNTHEASKPTLVLPDIGAHPDIGRPLTKILDPGETVAAAIAAELVKIADEADANAIRYAQHPDDHGGVGSASKCARTFATSLRWRAQMLLDVAANATGPVVA